VNYPLVLMPRVERDLREAERWSNKRERGVGEKFRQRFIAELAPIQERPLSFSETRRASATA
jgi:hypothetical protein